MTKASKLPTTTLDHMNRSVLPSLMKHRYSWPFLKACDYIALKIPDYPKIIRHPMDFTKVREKLRTKQYTSVNDCVTDIDTIFSNCYLFNQPGEDVVYMAMQLHAMLKDKLHNVQSITATMEPKVGTPNNSIRSVDSVSSILGKRRSEEREKLPHKIARIEPPRTIVEGSVLSVVDFDKSMFIIKEMMSSKYQKWNSLFLHPVDVKGLNLFDYYDIVKRPIDLTTIKSKLEARLYTTIEKFVDDIELVFSNCIKYNGEGTDLGIIAKKFQEVFREIYAQTLSRANEIHTSSINDKPVAISHKAFTPEPLKPTPIKATSDHSKPSEIPDKKQILDLLTKLQRQQDDLVTKSKKVEELMSLQNAEIEELYQKLLGAEKPEVTNPEFCDAGSLMSNMSECVLSSSTSTVSISRKSKRQIRPPKNQLDDIGDTPQSLSGKKFTSNGTRVVSTKKSVLDSHKKEGHVSKPVTGAHDQATKVKLEVSEEYNPMTYDDKRKLSIKINQLLSDKLSTVLQIIQNNEVAMQEPDPEEMEIDFETLQTKTLRELEKFVDSVMAVSKVPPTTKKSAHTTNNGVSKNKGASIEYISSYATECDRNANKLLSQSRCSSPVSSSECSDSSSSESGLSVT